MGGEFQPAGRLENEGIDRLAQKPVFLHDRIVKASCPADGAVLDPFAGCAATCVAVERPDRQWMGIDLWPTTAMIITERMEKECDDIFGGDIVATDDLSKRIDDGKTVVNAFTTPTAVLEPISNQSFL